jgi:class 3 adenylate cyclase
MSESEPGRPVVKTLLLTDFVESTQFVSALGDVRAAEIFAAHDHAARELLAEHGGQEIDKSDGFLFLFDRPIDAVRFSLAYHRLLARLSADLPRPLEARSGIHLGEVVMRTNPTDDVVRGAKPVEVEGLAKAKTARVMACACGNQTLLSESAYTIGHRAAVGADGLDESVRWMEHGLYPLKGIEQPVRLFEVGREGESLLTPPPGALRTRGARMPLILLGLMFMALVAAFVLMSDPEGLPPSPSITPAPPMHTSPAATAAPVTSAPSVAPEPAPKPVAAPAVKPLRIQVISTPPGAEIRYGNEIIGVAPIDLPVPPMVASHPIQARLVGHRDSEAFCRVTEADLAAGTARCEVPLKRLKKARVKSTSSGTAAPKSALPKSKPKIHMID